MDQGKDWGGVFHEGKGRRYFVEDKGWKNQADEERVGGLCPFYVRGE